MEWISHGFSGTKSLFSKFSFAPDKAILFDIVALLEVTCSGLCSFIPIDDYKAAHELAAFLFLISILYFVCSLR